MDEYKKYPVKTCEYCGNKGMAYTLMCGETICPLCLKDMPTDLPEARRKTYSLRQRIKELEAKLDFSKAQEFELSDKDDPTGE